MKLSFRLSVSFCAMRRPSVSALPPGAKGAMIRTGLSGQDCAPAPPARTANRRTGKSGSSADSIINAMSESIDVHTHVVPENFPPYRGSGRDRSEEHTSELQSRVDISYAVFCLK